MSHDILDEQQRHLARRLVTLSTEQLGISPASQDFSDEFDRIFA